MDRKLFQEQQFGRSWSRCVADLQQFLSDLGHEHEEKIAKRSVTCINRANCASVEKIYPSPLLKIGQREIAGTEQDHGVQTCYVPHRYNNTDSAETNHWLMMTLGNLTGNHPFVLFSKYRKAAKERLQQYANNDVTNHPQQEHLNEIEVLKRMLVHGELLDAQMLAYIALPELAQYQINVVVAQNNGHCTLEQYTPAEGITDHTPNITIYLRGAHFVELIPTKGLDNLLRAFTDAHDAGIYVGSNVPRVQGAGCEVVSQRGKIQ